MSSLFAKVINRSFPNTKSKLSSVRMGTVESKFYKTVNSLPARSEFRHLLMIFFFANSYDPDQARQNSDSVTEIIV